MAVGKHGGNAEMAERNTILRVRTGSGAHGISTDSSDRDEIGICLENPEFVIGLRTFEQHMFRDAAQRTGQFDAPSGAGDLDLTVYSLRKYARLALNGNPSMLEILFSTDHVVRTSEGRELQDMAPLFISKEAGPRYLGYLQAQRRSMQSKEGKGRDVTRPELVAKYGFDTKYAGHMIRLGFQGVELLTTGRISLPMVSYESRLIRAIRQGEYELAWCLETAEHLENQIKVLLDGASTLPDHPARDAVNDWLIDTYTHHWGYHQAGPGDCWEYV